MQLRIDSVRILVFDYVFVSNHPLVGWKWSIHQMEVEYTSPAYLTNFTKIDRFAYSTSTQIHTNLFHRTNFEL